MQEQVFCSLWEGPSLEQFLKDCTLEGTHIVAKGKYKAEGSADRSCYSLTMHIPSFPSPCTSWAGRTVGIEGMKSLGRGGMAGSRVQLLSLFPTILLSFELAIN